MINDILNDAYFKDLECMCIALSSKKTKNGKNYVDLTLRDASKQISAKIWDTSLESTDLKKSCVIICSGNVNEFNENKQLVITEFRVLSEDEIDYSKIVPKSPYDVSTLWTNILKILGSVNNPGFRSVIEHFVTDPAFKLDFLNRGAAVKMHHAFYGGLAQHTLFVMRICVALAKIYELDYDLLITAAFLHDVGKLYELSDVKENEFTKTGSFSGHLVEGAYRVRKVCESVSEMSTKDTMNLFHCILAHHGVKEFGSPVVPAIKEAIALNYADGVDAKMEMAIEHLAENDGEWCGCLGTSVYSTK